MTDGRNDSLLIIANLAYGSKQKVRGLIPSHLNIHTYINHLRSRRAFHAHGSVRLLMWMPDSEKSLILPRTVSLRKKLSIDLEMVCNVEEIAGGGLDTQIATVRETFLEIKSSKQVAKRMKTQNIHIPLSRQDVAPKQISIDVLTPDKNTMSLDKHVMTTGSRREWHSELKQLEQDYRDGKFPRVRSLPLSSGELPKGRAEYTPEFSRLSVLKAHFKLNNKHRIRVDELIQEQDTIDRLHSGILMKALNEPERQGRLAGLQQRAETFKNHLENQPKQVRDIFNNNSDNRRALIMDPPLLMWDRRTAEPLIVRENEFCNPTQLALLDFQPLSPSPYPVTSAQSAMFDLIMGGLLNHSNDDIYYLNSLAPGAADAIIPHVPALQDPRRGGRYDLSDFRIRCFTPEMLYGIFQAWENWPFKPPISEMVADSEELKRLT
ncbi:hypothetical protein MMC07_005746 [Pseudocyphellaria aurata]|nr:hypothetical protein [Pseudocyphellaria aurata]